MSTDNTTKKKTTLPEMPRELISEARKSYDQVSLKVTRQGDRGLWSTLFSGIMMPTGDLFTLEEWLKLRAGGGKFMVHTTDPSDAGRYVVPPFYMPLEGPPRPFAEPQQPGVAPVVSPHSPQYAQPNLTGQADPSQFMTQTPDAVAQEGRREARDDFQSERQLRETDKRRHTEEKSRHDKEMSDLRAQLSKIEARGRESALEAKFDGLAAQINQNNQQGNQRQGLDLAGLAAVATAVIPAVTAMITSGQNRSVAEATRVQASQDANTKMMMGVLTNANKPNDPAAMIKVVGALITPVIPLFMQMVENKNPTKSMEMMTMLGDQMLTQASLAGEMIRQIAGDQPEQPPWMPIVQQLASGLEDFGKMMMDKEPSAGGGMQRYGGQQQYPQQQHPQQPQVVPAAPPGAVPAQPPPMAAPAQNMNAQQRMEQVMGQLPPYLQTEEWAQVVFYALEEAEANVEGIAEAVADNIHHMMKMGSLPPQLGPVAQDPHNIAPLFFKLLPLSEDYADKLTRATVQELQSPPQDEKPADSAVVENTDPTNGKGKGPVTVEAPADAQVAVGGNTGVPSETH